MQRKKNRTGRPPIPKALRHRHRVVALLTDEQHKRLRVAAMGRPIGVYARELIVAALERETR